MDAGVAGLAEYVERAVDSMSEILTGLGDDLANQRPGLLSANSPYAILRHSLGVMAFWGGQVVADRKVVRDRAAEFRAAGPVADLVAAAQEAKGQFRADVAGADPSAPLRGTHPEMREDDLEMRSQWHALLHVLEEMTQHLGQMEITRDLLARR